MQKAKGFVVLALISLLSSAAYAESTTAQLANEVLTPGARLLSGDNDANEFYILGANEKPPVKNIHEKKVKSGTQSSTQRIQTTKENQSNETKEKLDQVKVEHISPANGQKVSQHKKKVKTGHQSHYLSAKKSSSTKKFAHHAKKIPAVYTMTEDRA